jgi:hypothetical protein
MEEIPYIYIHRAGKELGPFTERELRRHWANGVVDHDDLAWYEGMDDWISLSELFGVSTRSRRDSIELEHRERLFGATNDLNQRSGMDTFEYFNGRTLDPLNVIAWVLFVLGIGMMALFRENLAVWTPPFILSLGFATYNLLMRQRPLTYVLVIANLVLPAVIWFTFAENQKSDSAQVLPPAIEQNGVTRKSV